jgi:hypothetical protein
MAKNKNKSLFWYGFFANVKKGCGVWLLAIGIVAVFYSFLFGSIGGILFGILSGVGGGILLAKGSSQRFDYQRRSGYIMHGGDNWR